MGQVDTGRHLEQLGREVAAGGDARRREVQLAGVGLGIGDQFLDRMDGQSDGWTAVQQRRGVEVELRRGNRRDSALQSRRASLRNDHIIGA